MYVVFESREKGKITAYPILTFIQSFVKFQNMDPAGDTDER